MDIYDFCVIFNWIFILFVLISFQIELNFSFVILWSEKFNFQQFYKANKSWIVLTTTFQYSLHTVPLQLYILHL